MRRNLCQSASVIILALAVIGSFTKAKAQELPDEAALPKEKGAWVVDLFIHSNNSNGYAAAMPNNTRILVQSDGSVFRRRITQYRQFSNDSGWCRVIYDMKDIKPVQTAISKYKPGVWNESYGTLPNALAPFGSIAVTVRGANGKIIENKIKLLRFNNLPAGLTELYNAVNDAGDLALSDCSGKK